MEYMVTSWVMRPTNLVSVFVFHQADRTCQLLIIAVFVRKDQVTFLSHIFFLRIDDHVLLFLFSNDVL
jgi:hypothetical protein